MSYSENKKNNILKCYESGEKLSVLRERFGVSPATVKAWALHRTKAPVSPSQPQVATSPLSDYEMLVVQNQKLKDYIVRKVVGI